MGWSLDATYRVEPFQRAVEAQKVIRDSLSKALQSLPLLREFRRPWIVLRYWLLCKNCMLFSLVQLQTPGHRTSRLLYMIIGCIAWSTLGDDANRLVINIPEYFVSAPALSTHCMASVYLLTSSEAICKTGGTSVKSSQGSGRRGQVLRCRGSSW